MEMRHVSHGQRQPPRRSASGWCDRTTGYQKLSLHPGQLVECRAVRSLEMGGRFGETVACRRVSGRVVRLQSRRGCPIRRERPSLSAFSAPPREASSGGAIAPPSSRSWPRGDLTRSRGVRRERGARCPANEIPWCSGWSRRTPSSRGPAWRNRLSRACGPASLCEWSRVSMPDSASFERRADTSAPELHQERDRNESHPLVAVHESAERRRSARGRSRPATRRGEASYTGLTSVDGQRRRGGGCGADAVGEHGVVLVAVFAGRGGGECEGRGGGTGDEGVGVAAVGADPPLDGGRRVATGGRGEQSRRNRRRQTGWSGFVFTVGA